MKCLPFFILLLILLIGFFFRVYNLATNPVEIFTDELANTESAISVIERGHDLEGSLNVYFSDRVEFRPPLYGYEAYPFIKLFGNNAFGIRFASVLNGLFSIVLIYFFVLLITKKQTAALSSSFFLSIMPWHIHYSRLGWEPSLFLPLLLLSLFLMMKSILEHKPYLIILSFIFFGLTSYTYFGSPLFAFLFLSLVLLLNKSFILKNKKIMFFGLVLYFLIIAPIYLLAFSEPNFFDRAQRIYTFKDGFNSSSFSIFFKNYFTHFSPDYLFFKGDPNLRHGAGTGVLYLFMVPFIFIGGYYLLIKISNRSLTLFFLLWLLLFPIGASVTNDGVPHAHRTLIGAPLFAMFSGVGFWFLFFKWKQRSQYAVYFVFALLIMVMVMIISIHQFAFRYYVLYPELSASSWQYGHALVFSKVRALEHNYQRVCLGNLDYWGTKPLLAHYMKDSSLAAIEDMSDPVCQERGTIFVAHEKQQIPADAKEIDQIFDFNTSLLYTISTLD